MAATNCRPGDLAIVVNTDLSENLGQIVEVLGLQTGTPFIMSGLGHMWQVRTAGGRATLHWRMFDKSIVQHAEGPVPDRCLRPVSGLTDDDSVRTDLGKKSSLPRRKRRPAVNAENQRLQGRVQHTQTESSPKSGTKKQSSPARVIDPQARHFASLDNLTVGMSPQERAQYLIKFCESLDSSSAAPASSSRSPQTPTTKS